METDKDENSKEQAKKRKEEGNAHYKEKELDLAIAKYDEVILGTKLIPKHYPKIVENLPKLTKIYS